MAVRSARTSQSGDQSVYMKTRGKFAEARRDLRYDCYIAARRASSPSRALREPSLYAGLTVMAPLEVATMKQAVSLRESNSEIRSQLSVVEARHRELDQRLKELGRHPYPTPGEQREIAELKKQKLKMKDELAALRRAL